MPDSIKCDKCDQEFTDEEAHKIHMNIDHGASEADSFQFIDSRNAVDEQEFVKDNAVRGYNPNPNSEFYNNKIFRKGHSTEIPSILGEAKANEGYDYGVHDNHRNNYGDRYIYCKDCGYKVSTWGNTLEEAVHDLNTSEDHKGYHALGGFSLGISSESESYAGEGDESKANEWNTGDKNIHGKFHVIIKNRKTGEIAEDMTATSLREAEQIMSGASINMNHVDWEIVIEQGESYASEKTSYGYWNNINSPNLFSPSFDRFLKEIGEYDRWSTMTENEKIYIVQFSDKVDDGLASISDYKPYGYESKATETISDNMFRFLEDVKDRNGKMIPAEQIDTNKRRMIKNAELLGLVTSKEEWIRYIDAPHKFEGIKVNLTTIGFDMILKNKEESGAKLQFNYGWGRGSNFDMGMPVYGESNQAGHCGFCNAKLTDKELNEGRSILFSLCCEKCWNKHTAELDPEYRKPYYGESDVDYDKEDKQTMGFIEQQHTEPKKDNNKELDDVDISEESIDYVYPTKASEAREKSYTTEAKMIEALEEEYGDFEDSDEEEITETITLRKLGGYSEESIAKELHITYGVSHDEALEKVYSVEVSNNDKVAQTFFGKMYKECTESEKAELRMYGGSD